MTACVLGETAATAPSLPANHLVAHPVPRIAGPAVGRWQHGAASEHHGREVIIRQPVWSAIAADDAPAGRSGGSRRSTIELSFSGGERAVRPEALCSVAP